MKAEIRVDLFAIHRVMKSLRHRLPKATRAEAVVGYDVNIAPYAVYVHEDLTNKVWTRRGSGPKFLEEPSRLHRDEIVAACLKTIASTRNLVRGVYSASVLLLKYSLRVVPVKTGRLKGSAFAAAYDDQGEAVYSKGAYEN